MSNVYNGCDIYYLKVENGFVKGKIKEGIDTTFGQYMLLDGEMFLLDYENTFANKGFLLSRIYNPIARPLFKQPVFKNYLIKIGLLDYWKKNNFPSFCHPLGVNDFECNLE